MNKNTLFGTIVTVLILIFLIMFCVYAFGNDNLIKQQKNGAIYVDNGSGCVVVPFHTQIDKVTETHDYIKIKREDGRLEIISKDKIVFVKYDTNY